MTIYKCVYCGFGYEGRIIEPYWQCGKCGEINKTENGS